MAWGEWMVVKISVEEELRLEASVRYIQNSSESIAIAKLCSSLLRQTYFQQMLIKQATSHIALLEMEQLLKKPRSRRQALLRHLSRVLKG